MKKNYDYTMWLSMAADSGIDWENDPPPQEMITEELCIADLQDSHLSRTPEKLRSAEVCFAAVYTDDDDLQFVPENLREEIKARKDAITEEDWLDELSWYSGNHYFKLTEKLLTPQFCRTMVERNCHTIDLVPDNLKTPELQVIADHLMEKWEINVPGSEKPRLVQGGTAIVLGSMGSALNDEKRLTRVFE